MNKQIEKKCQDCLHYKMCLERFRKLKRENHYILIDENEYFAHADDCEFHIKSTDVAREIFDVLHKEIVDAIKNNIAVRRKRVDKHGVNPFEDLFCVTCTAKNHALDGIDCFIASLRQKYESEGAR